MRKHPIANFRITCARVLIRISFPALDNNFSSHPRILFQTLSFEYAKTDVLDLATKTGSPKYYSFIVSLCICSVCRTCRLHSSFTFSLIMANFSLLIICHEHSLIFRIHCSCCASPPFSQNKISEYCTNTQSVVIDFDTTKLDFILRLLKECIKPFCTYQE